MQESRSIQKRQVAYKIKINDLLRGRYVKGEGEWVPNYIETGKKHISRVNIMAVVVSKSEEGNYSSIVIDDGSGKISVRSFDENNFANNAQIGDIVLLVGRPREYGNERYIVPEIVKKIENSSWLKMREFELKKIIGETGPQNDLENPQFEEEVVSGENDMTSKIFDLIKNIDSGEGVEIDDIIKNSGFEGAEKIIESLLKNGEVFEVRSGRIKVLE